MDPFNPTDDDLRPEAIADRAANWVRELPPFRKAICVLMDRSGAGRCCIGVAGHLAGIQDAVLCGQHGLPTEPYSVIARLYGLRSHLGLFNRPSVAHARMTDLAGVNDILFSDDDNHARTAAFIRENVDRIWDEPLATLIKERLK